MKLLVSICVFLIGILSSNFASATQQFAACYCETNQDTKGSCYSYGCDWRIYLTGVYFDSNDEFKQVRIAQTESGKSGKIPDANKTQCVQQLNSLIAQGVCPTNTSK